MSKNELVIRLAEKYGCGKAVAESVVNHLERLECESQIVYEDERIAEFRDCHSFRLCTSHGKTHTVSLCIRSVAIKDISCGGDEYLSIEHIDYSIL